MAMTHQILNRPHPNAFGIEQSGQGLAVEVRWGQNYWPLEICCTVEALTPNCSAIFRTPGLPGTLRAC